MWRRIVGWLATATVAASTVGLAAVVFTAPAEAANPGCFEAARPQITREGVLVNASCDATGGSWQALVPGLAAPLTDELEQSGENTWIGSFTNQLLGDHYTLTVTLRGSAAAGFPESWTTEVSFDPTGAVYNQWGLPVAGATVSLLREDQGEFKLAPAAAINPGQNNPQTTTTDGVFLWDPMPGNYKIIAQAPNATVDKELAEMSMPPNRTGLIITMNVAGAQPPQPAQKPTFTSPQAGAAVKLDPIIWPDGLNVIEEVITWQVDGVPLLFGHNINLPVHLGGQRLTASIRAHVTRQKNFSGIAPQLATGTRENHNFTSFTYEIDAGTIAADPTWQAVISIPPPGTEEPSQPAATPSANSTIQAPKTPIKKLVKTPKPKIKGKLKVGQKLKVTPGKWDSGVKLSYRWYLSGKAIKGATKTSLKLTSKMVGKRLTIKVTGKRSGYQSITKVSAKTAKVKRK